jgi:hypothetical protein
MLALLLFMSCFALARSFNLHPIPSVSLWKSRSSSILFIQGERKRFQLYSELPTSTSSSTSSTSTSTRTTQTVEGLLVEDAQELDTSMFVWLLPVINMAGAFYLYRDTQLAFHNFMDAASGHLWVNVDGNNYMTEIVKPVLNGPVTLSISILFGTLISMTIQTLYRRQIALHQTLISTVEEVRELQWLVEGFPEPYKTSAHTLLTRFIKGSFQDFSKQRQVTPESLRTKEMTQMIVLLNELSKTTNSPNIIVCEAYGCVHRLKDRRAEFMSTFQTVFSRAHYVVIGLLAATLLFVFLLESDNDTLQFLLDFQLSICWALLIGSYSMLGVIIYDLSSPFTGIFTTMKGVDFVASERATDIIAPEIKLRDDTVKDNFNGVQLEDDIRDNYDDILSEVTITTTTTKES